MIEGPTGHLLIGAAPLRLRLARMRLGSPLADHTQAQADQPASPVRNQWAAASAAVMFESRLGQHGGLS